MPFMVATRNWCGKLDLAAHRGAGGVACCRWASRWRWISKGLFFLLIIAPVIVLFFLVHRRRDGPGLRKARRAIGVAGLALGIILAWALGVSFPMLRREGAHMIIGIGTDLANIDRIAGTLDRFGDRFRNRVFTEYRTAQGGTPPRCGGHLCQTLGRQRGVLQGAWHRAAHGDRVEGHVGAQPATLASP